MANYHQVKNAAILTPTSNTDLGSDSNRYSNVFMSGNIVMSNGVTVTSTNVITPKIASVTYPGNDTAADIAGGQTITITGSGFSSGASVLIGTTPSTVVTVVSSTSITFTSPALSAGNYALYVINSDGGTAIYIPGIAFSGTPTWSTSSGSLATVYETNSISSTVAATGDATISYSVNSGTLPTGSTLNSSTGLISGTAPASSGSTTYTFTIRATDGQNQDTDRSFSITVNTDSVTWSSPADNTSTELNVDSAMSNVTLSASASSGQSVAYTANALPTGLSISGANVIGTPTVVGSTTSLITATAANSGRTATRTLSWVVSVASEPYWPYVTLLLNGEGAAASNNAQNSTFIDSSTNAYTVTKTSGPTQGTNSPYSIGSWSNYLPGGTHITVPTSSGLDMGSGAYTVEGWFYVNVAITGQYTIFSWETGWKITVVATGLRLWGDNGSIYENATATVNPFTWYHFAWVRESTSLGKLYLNGTLIHTVTSSSIVSAVSGQVAYVGWFGGAFANYFNGYISNIRVVKGTSVYTANFTPSTTSLTAISGTTLLTCQSNRFKDNSTSNATLTVTGLITPSKFTPFNGTANYTPATHGGSVYFRGSSTATDALTVTMAALGTGDFTIECWTYLDASGFISGGAVFSLWSGGTAQMLLRPENDVYWRLYANGMDGSSYINQSSSPIVTNRWIHHAVVRISGTTRYYQDGILIGSTADALNYTGTTLRVGTYSDINMKGFISDFRVVAGTGVYTGSFTPPTQALTAISGTRVLLSFTNAGVIDQTGINLVTTAGDTKISTSVKKYNSGSISFDGNGDYLSIPNSTLFSLSAAKYTIEFWVYFNSVSGEQVLVERFTATSGPGYTLYKTGSNTINLYGSGSVITNTTVLTTSTWYHIAVTYDGTNTRIFVNGTLEATAAANITDGGSTLIIGSRTGGTAFFNGYIDDLRITKGYARYTANFTAPTSALITK